MTIYWEDARTVRPMISVSKMEKPCTGGTFLRARIRRPVGENTSKSEPPPSGTAGRVQSRPRASNPKVFGPNRGRQGENPLPVDPRQLHRSRRAAGSPVRVQTAGVTTPPAILAML